MSPVISQINTVAYEPYKNGEITQQEAVSRMADPLKQFMLRNTEKDTLDHFVQMSKQEVKKDVKEYPLTVVVPAFMTSELKKGFLAGFLIYLPFLLIDIVAVSYTHLGEYTNTTVVTVGQSQSSSQGGETVPADTEAPVDTGAADAGAEDAGSVEEMQNTSE